MYHPDLLRHPDSCPALVLNADYTPLSYYPLSLWPWQTAVKAMFLERVDIVAHYDREVHSPSHSLKLPSVIALKEYIPAARRPAFTRFNVFLRDRFHCQYCGGDFATNELTFDHVVPKSRGGRTSWNNVVTACSPCNLLKGNRLLREIGMHLQRAPLEPTFSHHAHHITKTTGVTSNYLFVYTSPASYRVGIRPVPEGGRRDGRKTLEH